MPLALSPKGSEGVHLKQWPNSFFTVHSSDWKKFTSQKHLWPCLPLLRRPDINTSLGQRSWFKWRCEDGASCWDYCSSKPKSQSYVWPCWHSISHCLWVVSRAYNTDCNQDCDTERWWLIIHSRRHFTNAEVGTRTIAQQVGHLPWMWLRRIWIPASYIVL